LNGCLPTREKFGVSIAILARSAKENAGEEERYLEKLEALIPQSGSMSATS